MEPTRHFFNAPASVTCDTPHRIALYDWGNPDAQRVVLCVHGLTRNARDFDAIAEALVATGRRVIAISMAGRGESDWLANPMGYSYATYVADCLAVIDNFHLRKVEWIGTSMGGIIGMMLTAAHPGRIRKLVLNDIGARLDKTALARIYSYVSQMPTAFADAASAEAYLVESFAPWNITDATIWQRFVASSLLTRDGALRYACDPAIAVPIGIASQQFTEAADVDLSPIWNEIQTPTLILRGAESDILSEETVCGMRATNLHAQSITFPAVGHAPPLMTRNHIQPVLDWLDRDLAQMMATSF
jgi:pimeloyl-ACP methyl ester carboxylesterase